MITFTFYDLEDRIPSNGEEIIYLRRLTRFDMWGFEPHETTAEYCWFAYDRQGLSTGDQSVYDPETESNFRVGDCVQDETEPHVYWKLEVMFDEYCVTFDDVKQNFLWVPVEEYWNRFTSKTEHEHSF